MRRDVLITLAGICILLFAVSCSNSLKNMPNGWYFMDDKGEKITGDAIVTTQDFAEIHLDSLLNKNSNKYNYEIIGKTTAGKADIFANATEKAIGKYIGFLYNGEIITKPRVNMRIESGNFSISGLLFDNSKKAHEVYNGIKNEMK